jgi:hypothetical protein
VDFTQMARTKNSYLQHFSVFFSGPDHRILARVSLKFFTKVAFL